MWSRAESEIMVAVFAFGFMICSIYTDTILFVIGFVAFIVLCAEVFLRLVME